MGLYIYCVVPAEHAPADGLSGIEGARVTLQGRADLGVWLSELDARPEPSVARIRAHNAVVEAAVTEEVTPVPVRFGQWLPSAEELERHMTERAEHYRPALQKFAGTMEFGVRALDPAQRAAPRDAIEARNLPSQAAITGRQYMAELREVYRARDTAEPALAELRERIHSRFQPIVRAEQFEAANTTHGKISVVHLVEHGRFDAYLAAFQALRAEFDNLRFLLSGPWPPYSFAAEHG